MNFGELKSLIGGLPDDLPPQTDVIVRCEWEDDSPNGNCFELKSISLEDSHVDGGPFVALDCDQEFFEE